MMLSKNKILVICEGDKTEPQILKKISSVYNRSGSSEHKFQLDIVSYKTNIYNFYKDLSELNNEFNEIDAVDTIDFLKIHIKNNGSAKDKKILEGKFVSLYLVFDYDFQDRQNNDDAKINMINKMVEYFDEDTTKGLLLINFPMIESLKHYKEPILTKENYDITIKSLESYKEYIHKYNNINITKFSKETIESLIALNLIRGNKLLKNEYKYMMFNNDENKLLVTKQIENDYIIPITSLLFILPLYFGEVFYKTLPTID